MCNSSSKGVAFKYGDGYDDDDDPELGAYSGFTIIIIFLFSVCWLLLILSIDTYPVLTQHDFWLRVDCFAFKGRFYTTVEKSTGHEKNGVSQSLLHRS